MCVEDFSNHADEDMSTFELLHLSTWTAKSTESIIEAYARSA